MADVGHVLGGRYHLAELVGQGGMATIYRARDTKLGRDVALKVLRGEYGSDVSFLAQFQREAQAAAQLNHPNVVAVFDYGQDPVGPYIVMELVTGGDLAGALRERGPLPPTVAASIGQQIADALDAAHSRGIVHRDIKPSNVLLSTGGRVKVADFGIAQAFTDAQLTLTGVTMGSVHYFSPEQARGEPVGTPSDIYSVGLVLYEMLTGQRAYSGGSAAEVAMARLSGRIPTPAAVRPDVPMALDAIVRWTLQPDPRARPPAAELSAALGRFLADPYGTSSYAPTLTPPPTPSGLYLAPRTRTRSCPRPVGWAGSAALIGLFVLVVAGVLLFLLIVSSAGGGTPTPRPLDGPIGHPESRPRPQATPFAAARFVGLTLATARTLADRVGLQLEEEHRQTDEAAPGTIIEQDPAVRCPSASGCHGPRAGGAEGEHHRGAGRAGRDRGEGTRGAGGGRAAPGGRFLSFHDSVPEGRVIRTDPRTGTEVALGTTVAYTISRGPRPARTAAPRTVARTRGQLPMRGPGPCPTPDRGCRHGAGRGDPGRAQERRQLAGPGPGPGGRRRGRAGTKVRLAVTDPAEPCT